MRGVAKENAKYMIIIIRGFCPSKETFIPVSDVRTVYKSVILHARSFLFEVLDNY